MNDITQRQQFTLNFIKSYIECESMAPTLAEIAEHLGVRQNAAVCIVRVLDRKGLIERVPGRARGIRLPKVTA